MRKINKKIFVVFALLLVIVIFTAIFTKRGHFYELDLFKSGQGWGYDVFKNNKLYIHQPYIPAVEGQVPFQNRKSARKTGQIVVKKIRNHESPALTRDEIKAIIGD
jgi:hypothetical protein